VRRTPENEPVTGVVVDQASGDIAAALGNDSVEYIQDLHDDPKAVAKRLSAVKLT
jgi:hypothetical protein